MSREGVMPDSVGKQAVFEKELDWSGLGWRSGQQFYALIAGPTCVIGMKYIHQTVNHGESIAGSMTGAHTQTFHFSVYNIQDNHQ